MKEKWKEEEGFMGIQQRAACRNIFSLVNTILDHQEAFN